MRCDAASLGVPCTNCVAFSIECKIPTPRRKKTQNHKVAGADRWVKQDVDAGGSTAKEKADLLASHSSRRDPSNDGNSPATAADSPAPLLRTGDQANMFNLLDAYEREPVSTLHPAHTTPQIASNGAHQFMRPKFARAPIKEAGRVAYLGESSNLSLLVQDRHGTTDVVHYPLPENVRGQEPG